MNKYIAACTETWKPSCTIINIVHASTIEEAFVKFVVKQFYGSQEEFEEDYSPPEEWEINEMLDWAYEVHASFIDIGEYKDLEIIS